MALKYMFSTSGVIKLPIGVKKCKICIDKGGSVNEIGYFGAGNMQNCNTFEFPIINGKSPNTFNVTLTGEGNRIYFFIEELGGVPDEKYFLIPVTQEEKRYAI